eukprot:TRINITY_DN28924_c0_g1_i1.p1 TRINITY_DN28924_c0_g1~~TRINITY_DN28924_c0_g1_i1.p1  ORF type:complete len:1575 (-),score=290.81 TRINITY_DN28924_c0_g1_i1:312-4940(-)
MSTAGLMGRVQACENALRALTNRVKACEDRDGIGASTSRRDSPGHSSGSGVTAVSPRTLRAGSAKQSHPAGGLPHARSSAVGKGSDGFTPPLRHSSSAATASPPHRSSPAELATGSLTGEVMDDVPLASVEDANVVNMKLAPAEALAKLLEKRPYLNPDTASCSHPLHYWVRRCRECIAAHDDASARKHLERVEQGVFATNSELRSAFARFDVDGSGNLDEKEFMYMCAYIGLGRVEARSFDSQNKSITFDDFVAFVGSHGGLRRMMESRRERVGMSQWGVHLQPPVQVGCRVQSNYYIQGKKSRQSKEAQVLAIDVKGQCPDAPRDGVLLSFGFGDDKWRARQVVPPHWITSSREDAKICEALQEVGIMENDQSFWASVFPESEMRSVAGLVDCQRAALRHVRQVATINHDKALPDVRKKFTDMGYGERELQAVFSWVQDLAPTVVHVSIDKVGHFMEKDDFYRNQFETHISGGAIDDGNQTRIAWEKELFGDCYAKAKPFERPKYGALGVLNDYRGVVSALQYGDSYLVLKDVRLRCTFAATDSGGIEGSRLAVLDKYAHVLNEYEEKEIRALVKVAMAAADASENPESILNVPQLLRGVTVDSNNAWVTLGFPDAKQARGRYYFEVTFSKGCAAPQVGLLSERYSVQKKVVCSQGVGDDDEGWAVDGAHAARWHGGKIRAWAQSWPIDEAGNLADSVVVGVAVDLNLRRMWFSSNGKCDAHPTFDEKCLTADVSLYPAVSLKGEATFNFGPKFHQEPVIAGAGFDAWPGLSGVVPATSPLVGNSSVLRIYKEIQIHGEVNLKRNVQRLVANRKYLEKPKTQRSYSLAMSGSAPWSGEYLRAGAMGEMPIYKHKSGAVIYYHAESKLWRLNDSENYDGYVAWCAPSAGGANDYLPPRKGWMMPDENQGVVGAQAFNKAMVDLGLTLQDVQRLLQALGGRDLQGHDIVYKVRGEASFVLEWKKLSKPPVEADVAWKKAAVLMQKQFLEKEGFANATAIETEHPYPAKNDSWTKDVVVPGDKGMTVLFASKSRTYDSCAVFGIQTGLIRKNSAGVGMHVIVKCMDGRESMRGHIAAKTKPLEGASANEELAWTVAIEKDDLENSYVYKSFLASESPEEPTSKDESKDETDKDSKAKTGENKDEKDDKSKPDGEKTESAPVEYVCKCPEEHISKEVKYENGKKLGEEISAFEIDRSSPLAPVKIAGFTGKGPAHEAGVQAGWYLNIATVMQDEGVRKCFMKMQEECPEYGEVRGNMYDVLRNIDTFLAMLTKLLEMSDFTLTFTNGLKANLVPYVRVTYDDSTKVGDEFDTLMQVGDRILVSNFKSPEGDAKPVRVARDACVSQGWSLDIDATLSKMKGTTLTKEQLLMNTELLRDMSGVTLFFEPGNPRDTSYFQACGDSSNFTKVSIPSTSATFTFSCDGDGGRFPDRRWGVFALALASGDKEPSQEEIDGLIEKMAASQRRAEGIDASSLSLECTDWDEDRLRALCDLHGWEFEWMTEECERERRLGKKARMAIAATAAGKVRGESSPAEGDVPDGAKDF